MPHVEESEQTAPLARRLQAQGITSEALTAADEIRDIAAFSTSPSDMTVGFGVQRGIDLMDTRDTLESEYLHGGTAFPETIADADRGFRMTPADIHAAAGTMSPAAYRMHRDRLLAEQAESRRSGPQTRPAATPEEIEAAREQHLQTGGRADRDPVQPTPEERQRRIERRRAEVRQRLDAVNKRREAAGLDPLPDPFDERDEQRAAQQQAQQRLQQQRAEEARRRRLSRSEVGREILRQEDAQRQQEAAQQAEQQAIEQERQQHEEETRRKLDFERQREEMRREIRGEGGIDANELHDALASGRVPGIVDEDGGFIRGPFQGRNYAELSPGDQAVAIDWVMQRRREREEALGRMRDADETGDTEPKETESTAVDSSPLDTPPDQRQEASDQRLYKREAEALPEGMRATRQGQGLSDQQYTRIGNHLADKGVITPGMSQDEIQRIIYAVAKEAGYDVEGSR